MPLVVSENTTERIRSVAEEVIAEPMFLVDVSVRGHKGSRVVEIYVDSDEVLSVDRLASVSREIAFLLDTEDVIEGRYSLNVSSPGVERPLTMPRQFVKHVGRIVQVSRREENLKPICGKLLGADENGFVIEADDMPPEHFPYDDATEVRVTLPW